MHPLPEYPRPSMRRDSYVNLNGPWDYAITQSSEFPAKWDGAILVPYSPEAKASGVGRTLQPGQWLHYHRTFTPPAGEGGRVLLHFGASAITKKLANKSLKSEKRRNLMVVIAVALRASIRNMRKSLIRR